MRAWQYSGDGQDVEPLEDWWDPDLGEQFAYQADFILDDTIAPGPAVVPYNSTFFLNGTEYELAAPFVKFGEECGPHNSYYTSMGSCVCYRGEPIAYDWDNQDNLFCVGKGEYAWGFSSYVTLAGLVLEAVWAIVCWAMWLDANVNSGLLKSRRRASGFVRNALDLADAVNRDLGLRTCAHSDKELVEALDRCDDVGFTVVYEADHAHIGVVHGSMKRHGKMLVEEVLGDVEFLN